MEDQIVRLLTKLISIPSVSGQEAEILDFVFGWMDEHNYRTVRKTDDYCAGLVNAGNNRALILAGHIDTVGGNVDDWSYAPTFPVIENEKLYGLGASDMKSAVAANMVIGSALKPKNYDLWVVAAANEEVDGRGTKEFLNGLSVNIIMKKSIV
jgi:succinyl-diaminopimelate desuccinylase